MIKTMLLAGHKVAAAGLIALALLAAPVVSQGAMAESDDYSLDYAVISSGSSDAQSQSGDYSVVSLLVTEGVATDVAASTDYSIVPVVGSGDTEQSSIGDWMLY